MHSLADPSTSRLARIELARQRHLKNAASLDQSPLLAPWLAQSWQRCLAQGMQPQQRVNFDPVSISCARQTSESSRALVQAARPILQQLGHALAETRYFVILTNQQGVVIDTDGPINRDDRRAELITRIGVDLSEQAIGTSAIGSALRELQPVWLHRGEHFFQDTSVYSCAGAPLFGPDGQCIGMLDLTGVEANERPELRHLAMHAARRIENALLLQRPHRLLLRLNWPGLPLGDDSDGLLTLDADGLVVAANSAARQLLPMLHHSHQLHARELFAIAWESLFDAARHTHPLDVPLWSGLRLQVDASLPQHPRYAPSPARVRSPADANLRPLKEIENDLIRRAVEEARGNVALAARKLGISRATVYRKLSQTKRN